jgi:Tol biopolymer transport system component
MSPAPGACTLGRSASRRCRWYARSVRWGFCLALVGCGFTPGVIPGTDALISDTENPMIDAPGDGLALTGCIKRWVEGTISFGAPIQLTELGGDGNQRDPFLSGDELTIYFAGGSPSDVDVFTATRTTLADTFSSITPYYEVTSNANDSRFSITRDLRYAVVSSNRPSGDVDIWSSRRANTSLPFPAFDRIDLTMVNTATDQHDPFITTDGQRLYFAHSNGVQRIALSTRAVNGTFSTPTLVSELDSGAGDADPALSLDERIIVYSSKRGGAAAGGNLWYATRLSPSLPFGAPKVIPDLNTDSDDGDPWLSDDGCRLYFASDRSGGTTGWEIYLAVAEP